MIIKTYLDKVNTIIQDSKLNTGLNPISELTYGYKNTRMLIHFDLTTLKERFKKNGVNQLTAKHILKMTNCGIVDKNALYKVEDKMDGEGAKLHASSFDLIFFLIPQEWDEGKGFDYSLTFFNQGYTNASCCNIAADSSKLIVRDGCNWYQARNGYEWAEQGVYDNQTLSKEYDNFSSENGSLIVIARQHFDKGDENICVDITETVNKFINGEIENYGIGIAYTPLTELTESVNEHYTGFFTNNTNTFFEPYLETYYDDLILDDRNNFIIDKVNRLYLYCNIDGFLTNLDVLPTCFIDEQEMEVKQASEGIYYVEVLFKSNEYSPNMMYYDIWSNIQYNGVLLDDVEMDFVTKSANSYFQIGNKISENKTYKPVLYGIQYDEKIMRGDVRKVSLISKEEYKRNSLNILDKLEYRLYVKDGKREITVIDYQLVNRALNDNFFVIDTTMLIPQRYYIDIKYNLNLEEKYFTNVLNFEIVNNITK